MQHQDYVLPDGTVTTTRSTCPNDTPSTPRGPTTADITTAFKKLPMTPSTLHIQPPHGETLVNLDTIFFTDPTTLDKTLTILNTTITLHITVAHYTWHYGDTHTQTTTTPGAAYPHQTIAHRYLHPGPTTVTIDTTYQADYRINNGPTHHLNTTVTIPSPPHNLQIHTATPHLVDN